MRIRATRHLHPETGVAFTPLSDEERAQIASRRDCFKRKLKMARILAGEVLAPIGARPELLSSRKTVSELMQYLTLVPF